MNGTKTAYVFDLDNTYLKTDQLKIVIAGVINRRFPTIVPAIFKTVYEDYKDKNGGLVDMPEILMELARVTGRNPKEQAEMHEIYQNINLRQEGLLMDPEHSLIQELGLENVFFLSMGDETYQKWKFRGCDFPVGFDMDTHIDVGGEKGRDVFKRKILEMKGLGFTDIVFVNDRRDQLEVTQEAADELGQSVRCVFMNYGDYAQNKEPTKEISVDTVHDFDELRAMLLPARGPEGQGMQHPGELK
jgi:hypothetical protein